MEITISKYPQLRYAEMGAGGKLPPPSGKPLLIMGDGSTLNADMDMVGDISGFDIMAVNVGGLLYPEHLTHWVSPHPELFFLFRKFRKRWGDSGTVCHCRDRVRDGADIGWKFEKDLLLRSSGGLALSVSLMLGYKSVVMAGFPMDQSGHFYKMMVHETEIDSLHESRHRASWLKAKGAGLFEHVRGVSGFAAEVFGGVA